MEDSLKELLQKREECVSASQEQKSLVRLTVNAQWSWNAMTEFTCSFKPTFTECHCTAPAYTFPWKRYRTVLRRKLMWFVCNAHLKKQCLSASYAHSNTAQTSRQAGWVHSTKQQVLHFAALLCWEEQCSANAAQAPTFPSEATQCSRAGPSLAHPHLPNLLTQEQGTSLPLHRQSQRQHAILIYKGWVKSPKDCQKAKHCYESLGTSGGSKPEKANWMYRVLVMRKKRPCSD